MFRISNLGSLRCYNVQFTQILIRIATIKVQFTKDYVPYIMTNDQKIPTNKILINNFNCMYSNKLD